MSPILPRRRGPLVLPILGAMTCGLGVAVQTRVNGALGAEIDHGLIAAVISFGTGLLIVAVAMLVAPTARRGLARLFAEIRAGRTPWWYAIGGLGGATLVFSQGIIAGILGVSLFSIGVVAGQTLSGTLIDRHGFGTMPPRRITVLRVVGACVALIAVVVAGAGQLSASAPAVLLILPFVAGLLIAWQQAANGQVRDVSHSVITATFMNFVVGTSALVLGALVTLPWWGLPQSLPSNPLLYLGGPVGVMFIALAPIVVRYTGVLLLTLGTIAGQMLGSIALDIVVPAAGHELGPATVIGVLLTLAAVTLAAWPSRDAATGTSAPPRDR